MTLMIIAFTIVCAILIIGGTLVLVPWRDIFERRWGNNPHKARIKIIFGEQSYPVNGKYYYSDEEGYFYNYKWDKIEYSLFVPANYPWRFLHGRREIQVTAGQDTASPLGNETYTGSGQALNTLMESRIAERVVRSVTGRRGIPWITVIIVIVALVAGYFILKSTGMFDAKQDIVVEPTRPPPATPTPDLKQGAYNINGFELEYHA